MLDAQREPVRAVEQAATHSLQQPMRQRTSLRIRHAACHEAGTDDRLNEFVADGTLP
jgi:hypothetical protein